MIIDIIIVFIFALLLYRGWKQGFLYNVGLIVLLLVAFFLASRFSSVVALKLYDVGVEKDVFRSIEDDISETLDSGKTVSESLDSVNIPKGYQEIVTRKNLKDENSDLIAKLSESILDFGEESKGKIDNLAKDLTKNLVLLTIQILSFIVILFLSYFIMKLILSLISKGINHLPLLGTLNRVLGLVVSFAFAILIVGTMLSLLPGLQSTIPELEQTLSQSKLAVAISDSRIYHAILDTIF